VWALSRLLPHGHFAVLRERYATRETDLTVLDEWQAEAVEP